MADSLLSTIEKSLEIGRPVAQAVVDAHAERGTYPEKLDELIPAYLEAIPDTADVRMVHNPDPKLIVRIRDDMTVGYDLIEKRWFSSRKKKRWLTEPPVVPSKPTEATAAPEGNSKPR